LIFLAGALKSGLSIEEAIRTLANEAPDPLRSELQGSVIDYHLWSSVSVRLDRLLRGPDLALARAALLLSKETGGKVSVVVEKAAVILNKKKDLNQKLKTLTAQGKASAWIVGLSPVGLLLMFLLLSPDFVAPLFKTGLGLKVLGLALTMLITGLFFVQRVCRLE
jgi:tight adherence protein B